MNDNINDIEIALRDGLIDELTDSTIKGLNLIARLTELVKQQEESINKWEQMSKDLLVVGKIAVSERDAARALAVRLEQECSACSNEEHHGSTY